MNSLTSNRRSTRRQFVCQSATAALTGLLLRSKLAQAAALHEGHPLAPKPTQFPAKARHLIFIFLTGGFSHLDTFDPKPSLIANNGKVVDAPGLRGMEKLPLLGSPFRFSQCQQSGLWISELFPQLQTIADDLCVIRTLHTDIVEHFQATLAMHTGSSTIPLPSIGSWLSYGLGSFNRNLPSFVVLAEHTPYAGAQVWDSNFLPPHHQGVRIIPGNDPIPNLTPPPRPASLRQLEHTMLRDLNEAQARQLPDASDLRARMNSFDVAQGMMSEAPPIFDVASEHTSTLQQYGVSQGDRRSFAWQCLVARRLVERGVRVVELIDTGSHDNWDSHGNMADHKPKARRVDQAITALVKDLKQRGLLSETLIACCTEFGRTPWVNDPNGKGRNHFARAFSSLLIGAGVRGGFAYGQTDEFGAQIISNPVHVHDYHATILHLMGIDHTQLTYRYAGRDFRLTDVAGNVIQPVLTS